MQLRRLW